MKHLQACKFEQVLAPITAATTARTANVDTSGADYATFVIDVGVEANTNSTNVAVALLESDDTTATNFATFDSDAQKTIDNASAAFYVLHCNLHGRKRYLRLSVTPDTTTNGAVITSAKVILDKEIKGLVADNATNIAVV